MITSYRFPLMSVECDTVLLSYFIHPFLIIVGGKGTHVLCCSVGIFSRCRESWMAEQDDRAVMATHLGIHRENSHGKGNAFLYFSLHYVIVICVYESMCSKSRQLINYAPIQLWHAQLITVCCESNLYCTIFCVFMLVVLSNFSSGFSL